MTSAGPSEGSAAEEAVETPEQEAVEQEKTPVAAEIGESGDMLDSEVAAALRAYAAGEASVEQTADVVRPAFDYDQATRDGRTPASNDADPDDATTPNAWTQVALAYQLRTITDEQHAALIDAVLAGPSAA
jgi:hypothetical protein